MYLQRINLDGNVLLVYDLGVGRAAFREFHFGSVRIALGAQRGNILKLILRHGGALAGVGIIAGLIMAAVTAPMISSLFYGIHPIDPSCISCSPSDLVAGLLRGQLFPRASGIQNQSYNSFARRMIH
jgi:hypothetical protein